MKLHSEPLWEMNEIGPTVEGMPGSIASPVLGTYRLMQFGPWIRVIPLRAAASSSASR